MFLISLYFNQKIKLCSDSIYRIIKNLLVQLTSLSQVFLIGFSLSVQDSARYQKESTLIRQ
jgi:hypothetical protein